MLVPVVGGEVFNELQIWKSFDLLVSMVWMIANSKGEGKIRTNERKYLDNSNNGLFCLLMMTSMVELGASWTILVVAARVVTFLAIFCVDFANSSSNEIHPKKTPHQRLLDTLPYGAILFHK